MNKSLAIDKEFAAHMAVIGHFETRPQLAVALSGGADSMSLLLLADDWAREKNGAVTALTVDHGLRPESHEEAQQVATWCKARGIAHHILKIPPSTMRGGIQAAARQARYALLTGWCKEHCILHLLSAHHRDDQAETLFFRLARGSGIDGLAGMPIQSQRSGIRLLRPLLSFSKEYLIAFLQEKNQPWIEDPSNQKDYYTRNLIRHQLAASGDMESYMQRASNVTQTFAAVRNRLEHDMAACAARTVSLFPEGYGIIHTESFYALPPEMALRLLSSLVQTLGGLHYPPRLEALQRFYKELQRPGFTRRNFGGWLFFHRPRLKYILVYREPKPIESPLLLAPDSIAHWDGRFDVAWNGNGPVTVKALGNEGIKRLPSLPCRLEKHVLKALPSFWRLEELLAVPHIGYGDSLHCIARFKPAKALAGAAFSGKNSEFNQGA